MKTITIVFKKGTETPFPNDLAKYRDVNEVEVGEGCIGVKVALGDSEVMHIIPLQNVLIATVSDQLENEEENDD